MRVPAIIFILFLLFSGCACDRKTAGYGPTLDVRLDNVIGGLERQRREAQMHEFLWNNWRDRKCATLHLTSISKEGKETDADYELRILPASTLVIIVTIKRARYGYQGQVFWHEDGKYDVYTVERVKPNLPEWLSLNPSYKVEVLPDNVNPSGSDYCLRFRGWGNEVLSFF
jgi:hypothetical protein